MLGTQRAAAALLFLSLCTAACSRHEPAAMTAQKAFRDPLTGELRAPSASERSQLANEAPATRPLSNRPQRIELADGGVAIRNPHMNAVCGSIDAQGHLRQSDCPVKKERAQ